MIKEIDPDYILSVIPPDRFEDAVAGFRRDDTISEAREKRFLIIYGAGHKGWFLRELRKRDDIELLEMKPFLDLVAE